MHARSVWDLPQRVVLIYLLEAIFCPSTHTFACSAYSEMLILYYVMYLYMFPRLSSIKHQLEQCKTCFKKISGSEFETVHILVETNTYLLVIK